MAKSTAPLVVQTQPAILRKPDAAAYMGISPTAFAVGVRAGWLPQPRRIGQGASGWLRTELDACAQALPVSDLKPGPGRKRAAQGAAPAA